MIKKISVRVIFAAIIGFVVFFTAMHLFMVFGGRSLIMAQLERATGKKVSLGNFSISAPLVLHLADLNIEGLAKIKHISVTHSIPSLFLGRVAFNEIKLSQPEFTFEKKLPQAGETPIGKEVIEPPAAAPAVTPEPAVVPPPTATPAPVAAPAPRKKSAPLRLVIKRLQVRDGRINFIDHTVGPQGITITVKDISFDLSDLYLVPRSAVVRFNFRGRLPWKEGQEEGSVLAEGWLNLVKKDMDATVKIEKIDGVYLYPYYSTWVDLDKARIENAKLNFTSYIHGVNNNITADCHLELTDIVRRPKEPEEGEDKAEKIATAVLDIFRAMNQGKIVLDFTIRTKMDRPEFGFANIKMAFEQKLSAAHRPSAFHVEEVLRLPADFVQGTFKGLTDLTTAVIGGTINVGRQIGKTIEGAVKGTEKPKEEKKQ
jgi:hypothetical protein